MSNIFEKAKHIDPQYQHLDKYVNIMYRSFWTPGKYEKLIREVDVPHYFNSMCEVDQSVVSRCILAISIVEDKVKTYWSTLALDLPQTIIGDVGGLFGMSEVTHRRSYHALAEYLKLDTDNLSQHDALRGRIEYLGRYVENDPKIIGKKRILKKLVLFTSLVERCSLFTQFYLLMSYAYHNRGLKTISALQETTAIEEVTHYNFGIDLVNIIKSEHPQLWDEYMIELITDNIKVAYQSEINLLDWFFESGVPSHLTKEEVVNFLNYNFNIISKDLGLDLSYPFNETLYREKNEWFTVKVFTTSEPDFFDSAVSGYSSEDEEEDLNNINF
jgi:ribonucleoside-diphosphate reductase beta chain